MTLNKLPKWWDVITGDLIKQIDHTGPGGVYFGSNETQLFSLGQGYQQNVLDIIDIHTGKIDRTVLNLPESGTGPSIAGVTPDGKKIIIYTSTQKSSYIWLWDISTKVISINITDQNYVFGFTTRNDQQLATIDYNDGIKIWDMKTGKLLRSTHGSEINGKTLTFSPDNTKLVVSSGDGIRIYSVQTGELLCTLSQDQGGIWTVAFNPSGTLLASINVKGSIRIWNTEKGSIIKQLTDPNDTAYWPISSTGIMFNSNGSRLIGWSWTENNFPLRIWDTSSWDVVSTIPNESFGALSPDGSHIAIINGDKGATILDTKDQSIKIELEESQRTSYMLFSPEGEFLYGVDWLDAEVNVWRVDTGEKITRINPNLNRGELPLDANIRIALSKDGSRLATIQYYHEVNVWNTKSWELIKTFKANGSIYDVAISNDGKTVAAFSGSVVYIWYLEN